MNTIAKIYKSKFKESLNPYGFKLYRKTFYRVVNDVAQTIMLNNWRNCYTVNFYIWSLFLGLDSLYCEGYELHELRKSDIPNWHLYDKYWEVFPSHSQSHIEEMVDEMLSLILEYVIPAFERVTDWKSGENEISYFGELFRKVTHSVEHVHNIEYARLNRTNYFMHIKVGEYEKAIEIAKEMIPLNPGWEKLFTPELELLLKGDYQYFHDLFEKNEREAREFLDNPSKHKRHYGS